MCIYHKDLIIVKVNNCNMSFNDNSQRKKSSFWKAFLGLFFNSTLLLGYSMIGKSKYRYQLFKIRCLHGKVTFFVEEK